MFDLFRRTLQALTGGQRSDIVAGSTILRSMIPGLEAGGDENDWRSAPITSVLQDGESGVPSSAVRRRVGFTSVVGLAPSLLGYFLRREPAAQKEPQAGGVRFVRPESIHAEGALFGENLRLADFGAAGIPREYQAGRPGTGAPTPVVIQIQALDSRSILDRSSEIAAAVREAMLHSHSLTDLMKE
jgi:hypothetical protein